MTHPTNTPTIVLASRNRKKSGEIAEILSPHGISLVSVAEFPNVPEVVEDGETFAANAAKKASETAIFLSQWTIGEDSGLEVDALDGVPGIYSARYSGKNADDKRNNAKLLDALSGVPDEKRGAQYVCHIALADPTGEIRLSIEATCRGRITAEARGANGFGYDPLFLVLEYHQTFGELGSAAKRHLSHRARALERFIPQLVCILRELST
jgi:XTP/dITP diphosphohydrolase